MEKQSCINRFFLLLWWAELGEMVTESDMHNIVAQEWTRMHVWKKVEGDTGLF